MLQSYSFSRQFNRIELADEVDVNFDADFEYSLTEVKNMSTTCENPASTVCTIEGSVLKPVTNIQTASANTLKGT